jgi:hypothetical protein
VSQATPFEILKPADERGYSRVISTLGPSQQFELSTSKVAFGAKRTHERLRSEAAGRK